MVCKRFIGNGRDPSPIHLNNVVVSSKRVTLVFLIMLISTCGGKTDMNSFESLRAVRTHDLHLRASLDTVFPLFDPINEKKWAADWGFKPVYPNPAAVEQGFIFKTQHAHEPESVWVLTRLDKKNHSVEYVKFEPDSKVVQIQIQCGEKHVGETIASVTYIQTALTEKGNKSVAEFTENHYKKWMVHWQQALNHYLETGQALNLH